MEKRSLGRTGLSVTPLCIGAGGLGKGAAQSGAAAAAERALATMRRVFHGPVNFIDTSNEYGGGESERRIGEALAENGGLPAGFVLATKVDPLPGSSDFSGDRVRASVAESLERLGLSRLQLVYLHDPEKMSFAEGMAPGGAVEALVALRNEGVIEHLGVAGGPIDLMRQYVATDVFDVVISHNRYTLVDQSAEPLLVEAGARGVAFVNGAPYGGGMLAKGPDSHPLYCYKPASAAIVHRVREMQRICALHNVPLTAAALQFSLREPRISSTIVGIAEPSRVDETLRLATLPIAPELWADLDPFVVIGSGAEA